MFPLSLPSINDVSDCIFPSVIHKFIFCLSFSTCVCVYVLVQCTIYGTQEVRGHSGVGPSPPTVWVLSVAQVIRLGSKEGRVFTC